ncbi:hypothetical protein AMAG_19238 [Allomyces macrogynus ATCC 38327]|uniref:Uncharacterized protein n=1 Tax=Allomyces macrogynus (strain ATCC 38327) TaxID=578462 RepID=A0A0L0SU96_ALLM3|nr:hypothetical protein AMAG_19238 [Allomyces macrogynus ATCC 38327]|eukprot:KNE65914.1 hypothetical protein AMAG_19238 [Allomyces macrogynus ATCC 38327]
MLCDTLASGHIACVACSHRLFRPDPSARSCRDRFDFPDRGRAHQPSLLEHLDLETDCRVAGVAARPVGPPGRIVACRCACRAAQCRRRGFVESAVETMSWISLVVHRPTTLPSPPSSRMLTLLTALRSSSVSTT